jgi:hypothetical protein
LHEDVALLMREVANDSMKEVKGLEDRLYGLDQLIYSGRKLVQEQADLAKVSQYCYLTPEFGKLCVIFCSLCALADLFSLCFIHLQLFI